MSHIETSKDGTRWQVLDAAKEARELEDAIADIVEGWFANEPRIDWDEFADRLDKGLVPGPGADRAYCSEEWDSPFWKEAKKIARRIHRAVRE